jgi:hypothetical protein
MYIFVYFFVYYKCFCEFLILLFTKFNNTIYTINTIYTKSLSLHNLLYIIFIPRDIIPRHAIIGALRGIIGTTWSDLRERMIRRFGRVTVNPLVEASKRYSLANPYSTITTKRGAYSIWQASQKTTMLRF